MTDATIKKRTTKAYIEEQANAPQPSSDRQVEQVDRADDESDEDHDVDEGVRKL